MGNDHGHRKKKKDYNINKIENSIQQNEYPKNVVIRKSSQFQIYYHSAHYYYNPQITFDIDINVEKVNNLVVVTNILADKVQNLFIALTNFKNIDTLQLKFGPCNYLKNSDIVELSNQIEIFQNLKSLQIDFSSNFKLDKLDGQDSSNLGVSKLAKAISQFSKLKNLEINFESCQLRDQSLSDFLDGLYNSKIESLALNLSNSMISEKAGYSLAMLLNNQEGLIEKLRLKIVLTKIKDEFFEQFFKFIKIGHFKLKVFGISIASCEMNNSIIRESMLGNFLKLNMSIEDFSLNIQNNQVNDEEISQFIDSLTSHSNIKRLKLNFSNNKITDKSTLEYIGKSLAKMDKLTHLNLQFEYISFIQTLNKSSFYLNQVFECRDSEGNIADNISEQKSSHPSIILIVKLNIFDSKYGLNNIQKQRQNIISHQFIDSLHEVFSQDISSLKVLEIDIGQKSIDKISDHLCSFIRCLNSSKSLELQILKLYFPTAFADSDALEEQLSQMKVSIHTLHLKVSHETGSDKLCQLQSYQIILERRSIFCLVVAFIRNCIDQIPVNPYHVFWDLYLD
ncbi:hypothetical protein ABPG74_014690 [Tetrahymena malaccensis]